MNKTFTMTRIYPHNDPRIKGVCERFKEYNITYELGYTEWVKEPVTIIVYFTTYKQRKFLEHLNFKEEE